MNNNTLKQYKKAIRAKYEIEKEGKYFDYLYKPSRGKLRDLCWLIFENNPSQDDLNVFRNLLGLEFDHTKKNKFKEKKDKFRPIETFFKGETDPANIDVVNMAAILVDFQPRPFKKFYEDCRIEGPKQHKSIEKAKAVFEKKRFTKEKRADKQPKKKGFLSNFMTLFL
nr:hypothetical protein [uncultured Flavobacterium sp.]